jgi:glycosyltransferase involved in cell wall biosynthesis
LKKLAIITVNLNNAIGLEKTISSVVSQTFTDYDYFIIDGQSTDNSLEIIKYYSDKITNWVSEKDNGIYNAMNKGINLANSEYMLFLNSGDSFTEETALSKLFNQNFTEDIIYCNLNIVGINKFRKIIFPEKLTFYWLYTEFIGHSSTLIKNSLFKAYGNYNENNKIVSDWEFFMLVICKYQCSTRYFNYTLSNLVEGGVSNNENTKQIVETERQLVVSTHFSAFKYDYEQLYNFKYNSIPKRIKRALKNIKSFLLK